MKIDSFRIRRFKSLRDVSIEDIGNLAILIGENGSGKTNILEILNYFFNDFQIIGGPPSPVFNDNNAWYRKRSRAPIEVILTIELDDEEVKRIYHNENILKNMKNRYEEDYNKITFSRQIIKPKTPWITKYIKLGKLDILEDDAFKKPDEINNSFATDIKKPIDKIKVYFFQTKKDMPDLSADHILIMKNKAYFMDKYTDQLIMEGKISFEIIPDIDVTAWAVKSGFKTIEKSLKRKQIEPYIRKEPIIIFTAERLIQFSTFIKDLMKNCFIYIQSNRDVRAVPNTRVSFIDKISIIDPFCQLSDPNLPAEDEEIYVKILDKIHIFFENQLDMDRTNKQIKLWEHGTRFSLKALGGGIQVIISLMWQIYSAPKGSIFAIEEPEIHLHPELSGKLFDLFKKEADISQILVVTHVPKFIDQTNRKNNWKVWKDQRETKIERVQSKKDLVEILNKLGARPVDRLYPNKVLLACKTESTVLSILAKNLRYKIDGVLLPLLEGDLDKRKIKIHADFVKDTQTILVLVLDEHGEKNAKEAIKKGHVKEENCFVLDGTIEDYYPKDILVKVLKDLFGVEVSEEALGKPVVTSIQKISGIPKKWKISVADAVAEKWMKDVPEDLEDVLKKLDS